MNCINTAFKQIYPKSEGKKKKKQYPILHMDHTTQKTGWVALNYPSSSIKTTPTKMRFYANHHLINQDNPSIFMRPRGMKTNCKLDLFLINFKAEKCYLESCRLVLYVVQGRTWEWDKRSKRDAIKRQASTRYYVTEKESDSSWGPF